MALVPTQTPTTNGAVVTKTAGAATQTFANSGRTIILVDNASGGSINVTVTPVATLDGQAGAAKVVAVAAGAEKVFGPYPASIYNDVNGEVTVALSAFASVTIGVISF